MPHDHPGARGGRAVRVDLGLHRARRPVGRQQARARVARQVRRAARARGWGCCRCSSRRSPTGRSSRPTGSPGRARSSTACSARPKRQASKHHPPVPTEEFEKPDLLRLEKETLGLYVSEHPLSSIRGRAAGEDRRDDRRARAAPRRRERRRRRDRQRGQAAADQARRADGLPAPRRRHRRDRLRRLRRAPTPPRPSSASPTGS